LTSQPANKQTDRRDKTAGQDSTRHQITKSSRRSGKGQLLPAWVTQ